MGRPALTEKQKKFNADKMKLQTWIDPLTARMLESYIKDHSDNIKPAAAIRLIVAEHLSGLYKDDHAQLGLL